MRINKDRIKFLIKKKTLKQKDVAEKLGVAQQDFNNWMFRGIFPHFNKLEELAAILEADVTELYYPEGAAEPTAMYRNQMAFHSEELIPFYEIDPQLGHAALWADAATIEPKEYVYLPGLNSNFMLSYFGKGMEPYLENGDWIALRRIQDTSFFNYGKVHVIVTHEQMLVRTVRKASKRGTILLVAHDDSYDPIELPVGSIKALFAVVAIVKRTLV